MNKRKLFTLALTLCMVAILAIGGTLAYFTDTEIAKNTFTVGDIEIDLFEHDEEGNEVEELEFEKVLPGVKYDKDPTIENIGENDAYVRVKVTVANALNWSQFYGNGFLMNEANFNAMIADTLGEDWEITDIEHVFGGEYGTDAIVTINYTKKLAPGETTTPVFTKVMLPASMTETDITTFLAGDGVFHLDVLAEAIQADSFVDHWTFDENATEFPAGPDQYAWEAAFEAYDAA